MSVPSAKVGTNMTQKDYGNAKTAPGAGRVVSDQGAFNSKGKRPTRRFFCRAHTQTTFARTGVGRPWLAPSQIDEARARFSSDPTQVNRGR